MVRATAARLGQPLLVLVSLHAVQHVGFAGELDKIRMGGDQGRAATESARSYPVSFGVVSPDT